MTTPGRPLRRVRRAVFSSAVLTAVVGASVLVLPVFVLQVLADIVPAGSIETLVLASATAAAVLAVMGLVEFFRNLILLRAGLWLDHSIAALLLERGMARGASADTLRSVIESTGAVRRALSCGGFAAALELPWVFVACGAIAFFDPVLAEASAGVVILTYAMCRGIAGRAKVGGADNDLGRVWLEAVALRVDNLAAMGAAPGIARRWELADRARAATAYFAGRRHAASIAFARTLHAAGFVGVMSLGGYLAITTGLSLAVVVAAALIVSRAQASVGRLIDDGGMLREGRTAWRILKQSEQELSASAPMKRSGLSAAQSVLSIEFFDAGRTPHSSAAGQARRAFQLSMVPGECLGIVGARGSGKSRLIRAIAGTTADTSLRVALDGVPVALHQRGMSDRVIGYAADQPDLLSGTVAQNISGFEADNNGGVETAVLRSGVRQCIAGLSRGLDTDVGELSFRQARAVAFARALYGSPRLLVLDEPELGLNDAEIEQLAFTLEVLGREGATIVMATTSPRLLRLTQRLVLLSSGSIEAVLPSQHVTGDAMPNPPMPVRAERAA